MIVAILAVRMSERQLGIREAWSIKQKTRNLCDDCVILAANHIQECVEAHKRETFFWALSDDLDVVLDYLEQIASVADNMYIGRSGHPGMRMWGRECGLNRSSTMKPHCESYRYMVVVQAEANDVVVVNEAAAIQHLRMICGSKLLNRSLGYDGPIIGDMQFLYCVFNTTRFGHVPANWIPATQSVSDILPQRT